MSDVFVSYKAEDRKRVRPLVEALEADGYSVWWDEQIGGGTAWRQSIEAELNAAKCVIVVWSKRSVGPDGTFVQDEATRAQQRHVYVPVTIDKVHLPLGFGETQALPLTGWHGGTSDPHYRAVLDAVRRITGRKGRASTSRTIVQAPVSRRAVIGGGAVAAVAVAGVGAWELFQPSTASASESIAVLPFANLSGDPAQAYFSDGVAEEIRSALARVGGLKVAGSTSSEAVRHDDAQTAARKLGVANILTGSVRQSPSMIRVNAELIDGSTGLDKWSQGYDRNPGDSIKIQTDIAENVASALSAALGRAARAAIIVGGTSNSAAHDLYLKAKAQMKGDDSESSLRTTLGLLDSAITLDPEFADAYALKARSLANLHGYYTATGGNFGPGFAEAAAVARKAISLAPNLAAGHMTLAGIEMWQLDIGGARAEFERGHSLAGGDVDDLLAYGFFQSVLGRTDKAIATAKEAQAGDPLNADAFANEASAQFSAGRLSQAEAGYRRALALVPNQLRARAFLGGVLSAMGKFDEAASELKKLPADNLFKLVSEAIMFERQGNRVASDAAFARARQVHGENANYQYAEIYAQRGEKDQAFAALDRAWSFRDPGLAVMKSDGWLVPLRGDPRFIALLRNMNFPLA